MGSAASKATRRVPSRAGLRAPTAAAPDPPLAFERRNEAIETDAKDPQFTGKLNQLGPVRVDHHMQTVRAASDIQNMYRSRIRSEAEASSVQSTRNRLLASSLTELLEARKAITTLAELDTLAKRYHTDVAKLQQLCRVVNTPSIDESTVVGTTDKHGEESLTMMARWVDPVPPRMAR